MKYKKKTNSGIEKLPIIEIKKNGKYIHIYIGDGIHDGKCVLPLYVVRCEYDGVALNGAPELLHINKYKSTV